MSHWLKTGQPPLAAKRASKSGHTNAKPSAALECAHFIFADAFLFRHYLQRGKGDLSAHHLISIEDADSIFENSPTKVVANRNEEAIELPGLKVGPFEEGVEYELRFWVASELQKAGVVRFREEDTMDLVKLHKVHWKERVQPTNRVSPLPHDFYPRLRRHLTSLIGASEKDREKLREHEKSVKISNDLVNCRVKKLVSLASAPPLTEQALKGLTTEERSLYHRLNKIISEWRSRILKT